MEHFHNTWFGARAPRYVFNCIASKMNIEKLSVKKKLFIDSDILRISSICHIQWNVNFFTFFSTISVQFLYNVCIKYQFCKIEQCHPSQQSVTMVSFFLISSQKGSLKAHIKNNMKKMFYKFTLLGSILSDTQWQLQKQKKMHKKHCFFLPYFFCSIPMGF